jgi:hypothetical protein
MNTLKEQGLSIPRSKAKNVSEETKKTPKRTLAQRLVEGKVKTFLEKQRPRKKLNV